MNKYILNIILAVLSIGSINSSSIPQDPAQKAELKRETAQVALKIIQLAAKIPKQIDAIKNSVNEINTRVSCFGNASSPECAKLCTGDTCHNVFAGMVLNSATKIINPALETLFGEILASDPNKVSEGIIPLLLAVAQSKIKNKTFQSLDLYNKALSIARTINLAMIYLNGISVLLAPVAAATDLPPVQLDPVSAGD